MSTDPHDANASGIGPRDRRRLSPPPELPSRTRVFYSPETEERAQWTPPEEGVAEQAFRILRRRKWTVLTAIIIVPVLALLYSLSQPKLYTATAGLLFQNPAETAISPDSADVIDPSAQSATNSSLISLPVIATYASRQTAGRIGAAEIHSSVSTSIDSSTGSSVGQISAESSSPARAAQIANAYGAGFIAFSRQSDQTALAASIRQVQASIAALPSAPADAAQRRELTSELTTLQNAEATNNGGAVLVQPASPPSAPSSPKTTRNVAIAVVVGVLLGVLLALLLDRLDQRIREGSDFERIYGLPVLAEIPRSRDAGRGELDVDLTERFRALRASLRYVNLDQRSYVLLIASPMSGDGKSMIARGLATTMARMGDSVVLVNADLRKRSRDGGGPGLSGVLVGDKLDSALEYAQIDSDAGQRQLAILPAGPVPPNPTELLESPRMRSVIKTLEGRFDFVVIDAPALASVSDALSLIPAVSGMLLVGALGHTTTKSTLALRQQVALLGGHPVGLVTNFVARSRSRDGYGYLKAT